MIIELIIGQLLLACFNIGNVHYDAYRILKHKNIAHGVNFIAYLLFTIGLCFGCNIPFKLYWLLDFIPIVHGAGILFLLTAFFNRQFTFDIPLNLRRGLEWYYQTKATGKKASILDRIERFIFGQGEEVGKFIFCFYIGAYAAAIISFSIVYG